MKCEVISNATAQNKESVGGALRARCPVCSLTLRSQNVPGFSPGGDRAEVPQKLHERTAFFLHSLSFSFLTLASVAIVIIHWLHNVGIVKLPARLVSSGDFSHPTHQTNTKRESLAEEEKERKK